MRAFPDSKFIIVLIVAMGILTASGCQKKPVEIPVPFTQQNYRDDSQIIARAYENKQSDVWVESTGEVIKILDDDLEGSRHQRFIIQYYYSNTLLVSHNIDIAPRINELKVGDRIYFRGEYEWNNKGGVIHWTHHDPNYRKVGGWIDHNGMRYQ